MYSEHYTGFVQLILYVCHKNKYIVNIIIHLTIREDQILMKSFTCCTLEIYVEYKSQLMSILINKDIFISQLILF